MLWLLSSGYRTKQNCAVALGGHLFFFFILSAVGYIQVFCVTGVGQTGLGVLGTASRHIHEWDFKVCLTCCEFTGQ